MLNNEGIQGMMRSMFSNPEVTRQLLSQAGAMQGNNQSMPSGDDISRMTAQIGSMVSVFIRSIDFDYTLLDERSYNYERHHESSCHRSNE